MRVLGNGFSGLRARAEPPPAMDHGADAAAEEGPSAKPHFGLHFGAPSGENAFQRSMRWLLQQEARHALFNIHDGVVEAGTTPREAEGERAAAGVEGAAEGPAPPAPPPWLRAELGIEDDEPQVRAFPYLAVFRCA